MLVPIFSKHLLVYKVLTVLEIIFLGASAILLKAQFTLQSQSFPSNLLNKSLSRLKSIVVNIRRKAA